MTPSVGRAASANALALAVALGTAFFQAPFILAALGEERYGSWTLIGLIAGYYGLFDLGTRGAVTYFVARARALDSRDQLERVVSTAFWFLIGIGAVAAVAGAIAWMFLGPGGTMAIVRSHEAATAVVIAVAIACAALPLDVFAAVVIGARRAEIVSIVDAAARVLTTTLVFVLLPVSARLETLALITLAGRVLTWSAGVIAARAVEPRWTIRWRAVSRSQLRDSFRYASRSVVANVAVTLIERLDAIVIGAVLGTRHVTIFVLGQMLVGYLAQGINAFTLALTPFFADLTSRTGHDAGTQTLLLRGTHVATTLGATGAAAIAVFGGPFLALWVGPTYVTGALQERSDVVMLILLVATLPRLLIGAGQQYLFGANKHAYFGVVLIVEGIANLVLSLILVRPLGMVGVAIGTLIPSLVSHGIVLPRYVCRQSAVAPAAYAREGHIRGLVIGAIVLAAGAAVRWGLGVTTWWHFGAGVVATLGVIAAATWGIGLRPEERRAVVLALRSGVPGGR